MLKNRHQVRASKNMPHDGIESTNADDISVGYPLAIDNDNFRISPKLNPNYIDHLSTEDLVPPRLSKSLLISAHAFLSVAYFGFRKGYYPLTAALTTIYLTSLWHWHHPKKHSIARKVDIFCVFHALSWGTYYATVLSSVIPLWFSLLALMAVGFVSNAVSISLFRLL